MKITKRRIEEIIKEETFKLLEAHPADYDPLISGVKSRPKFSGERRLRPRGINDWEWGGDPNTLKPDFREKWKASKSNQLRINAENAARAAEARRIAAHNAEEMAKRGLYPSGEPMPPPKPQLTYAQEQALQQKDIDDFWKNKDAQQKVDRAADAAARRGPGHFSWEGPEAGRPLFDEPDRFAREEAERQRRAAQRGVRDAHAPTTPQEKPSRWQRFSKSKLGRGLGRLATPLAVAASGYDAFSRADKALSDEGFDIPLVPRGLSNFIPGVDQAYRTAYDYYGIPTSAHVPGTGQLPDVGDEGIDWDPKELAAGLKQAWKEKAKWPKAWLDSAKQEESKQLDRWKILSGIKTKKELIT